MITRDRTKDRPNRFAMALVRNRQNKGQTQQICNGTCEKQTEQKTDPTDLQCHLWEMDRTKDRPNRFAMSLVRNGQNKRQTQQICSVTCEKQTEQKTDPTDQQWSQVTNRTKDRPNRLAMITYDKQTEQKTDQQISSDHLQQGAKDRQDTSSAVTCDGEIILRQTWQTNKKDRQINGQTWWINNGCLRCLPIQVNDAENGVWHIASGNPLVHSVDIEVKRPVRFPQHSDSVPYLLRMWWRNNAVTVTVHVRKEALFGCLKQCWNGYSSSKKGSIVLLSQTMQERLQF